MAYNELEYMVLAMVKDGVNSGYAMRRQMQALKGGRWSAESGSVYRVLRRLEDGSLVVPARKAGVKNRERTEYELTVTGEMLVLRWLTETPSQDELTCLVDALRTRTYFLGTLTTKQQAQTIKNWISQNRKYIAQLQSELCDGQDGWARINLLYLAKARQEWLRLLYKAVRESDGAKASDGIDSRD